jgi:hypothetical protein
MRRSTTACFLAAALALAGATGCKNVTPPGAYFDTSPPGAEVFVDGRSSGRVTPCLIALDEDDRIRVRLVLPGYRTREIVLLPRDQLHRIPWGDGAYAPNGERVFFALDAEDLFTPLRDDEGHAPDRVFVRLEPVDGVESSGS